MRLKKSISSSPAEQRFWRVRTEAARARRRLGRVPGPGGHRADLQSQRRRVAVRIRRDGSSRIQDPDDVIHRIGRREAGVGVGAERSRLDHPRREGEPEFDGVRPVLHPMNAVLKKHQFCTNSDIISAIVTSPQCSANPESEICLNQTTYTFVYLHSCRIWPNSFSFVRSFELSGLGHLPCLNSYIIPTGRDL